MGIFRRRAPRQAPAPLPLVLPGFDGTGWPDQAVAGRPSFEASTWYEMGSRRAYDPEAHALADRLVSAVLPRLATGASAEDAPYLAKVLRTAARIGVGIGLVERDGAAGPDEVDPAVVGALGQAQRGLPAMREDWHRTGTWFLLAGHYLARQDVLRQDEAVRALAAQVDDRD